MASSKQRPTSPGQRSRIAPSYGDLSSGGPVKSLTERLGSHGGRNNHGHVTSRHRGGGHKRRYRIIDFKRNKTGVPAKVEAIEYDPYRTAHIARLVYADGERGYILAPVGLTIGQQVLSSASADIKPGNCLRLKHIPLGTNLHCLELRPGKGGQLVRSAGVGAQLMAKEGKYATVRLPSGEFRRILLECRATVGQVGNTNHFNSALGKAGRSRWMGIRPAVRGVAMNPVDHPMGGGEGRTSGGRHPCTPWGHPTKGKKTRHNKRTDQYIVKRRSLA